MPVNSDINYTPRNISVAQLSNSELQISWEAPIETASLSGYRVYRTIKEHYDELYPIGCTANLNYIDSGLLPENYYYYMVTSLYYYIP